MTTTTNYSFNLPTVSGDAGTWGAKLNTNWTSLDNILGGTTPITAINIDGGAIDGAVIGANSASTGAFTSATISGELTATSLNENASTITQTSGTVVLDFHVANNFEVTLTENITTLTLSNPPATGTAFFFTLKVTQDSTARTINFGSIKFAGGTAPTLSTGSGAIDTFVGYTITGSEYFMFTAGQAMA